MADRPTQSFQNHTRRVPGYVLASVLIIATVIWSVVRLFGDPSLDRAMLVAFSVGTMFTTYYARVFALTAQDRIIRLEMQLRLARLLPPELQARAAALTHKQLVALRFASDEELPELTRRVIADDIRDGKQIKQLIRDWQGDYLRV